MNMLWLVSSVGVLAVLFIVVGGVMTVSGQYTRHKFETVERTEQCAPAPAAEAAPEAPTDTLPGGFKGYVLAMEFVKSKCDIAAIIGNPANGNRAAMHWQLRLDTYLFIPVYWLLYTTLAVLLLQRTSPWARWLGAVAIACAAGAALFDLAENARIADVLGRSLNETTDALAYAIREAALLKWALSFVATGVIASVFFLADYPSTFAAWTGRLTGICFVLAAVVGFCGLWNNRLISWVVPFSIFGLAGLIILSFKYPRALLPG